MSLDIPGQPGTLVGQIDASAQRSRGNPLEILPEVKPKLRGWLHAVVAPMALVAGIVLLAQSPEPYLRWGQAAFVASAVVLFTVSALYHRRVWSARTTAQLRRLDHANIFVHIAGTYTAFALLFLDPGRAAVPVTLVWLAAGLGIALRVCWMDAPRWLHAPLYGVVAGVALLVTADFALYAGHPAMRLMVAGGALYLVGGLVYCLQRPNPVPTWCGFHEIFHAFTVVAFTTHFVGVSMANSSLG
jgi:hemolysin III